MVRLPPAFPTTDEKPSPTAKTVSATTPASGLEDRRSRVA